MTLSSACWTQARWAPSGLTSWASLRDVGGADDFDGGVLGLRRRNLEDVAPDVVDGLELEGAGDALGVALFDVEGGGQPEVGLDVGAPAVEVVVLADGLLRCRRSRR